MLERIFIAIVVFSILFLLFKYFRRRQLRSVQREAAKITTQTESQLLYFSSTFCTQCVGQARILGEIFEDKAFKDIKLKKYAIESDAKLAEQWGVKTLPTTILLSGFAEIKHVNNGLISTTTLLSQLNELVNEK